MSAACPNSTPTLPQALTATEVAERLKVSKRSVQRLVEEHAIPFKRLGPRILRFDPGEIAEWWSQGCPANGGQSVRRRRRRKVEVAATHQAAGKGAA